MKRSISVPLIFLGTLGALSGCSFEPPANTEVQVKQDFYASLEDCQRDWGKEPENCQQAMTTNSVNGQDDVTSGFAGGGASSVAGNPTSAGHSYVGSVYPYSGPRHYWYHTESGGYPMQVDRDGKTRPVFGSNIRESGARFSSQTVGTRTPIPTHMTASKSVSRGGFGGTGRGTSAGG